MKENQNKPLRSRSTIFGVFLLLSILLHLLIGLLLQNPLAITDKKTTSQQTPVDLQERANWLELDQKPQDKTAEPPADATHIAEANQKVEQETAPKADDSRDQQRTEVQPQQTSPQVALQPKEQRVKEQKTPRPQTLPQPEAPPLQADSRGTEPPQHKIDRPSLPVPVNLPNLKSLTSLAPRTQARLSRQQDRPEIELKADEVWLNLRQDDKLISFFRRFRDRIEAVWNYPVEASSRGVEGTLLIKIIVDKNGELLDALPIESSGSDVLDYEAISAIYRAAPFGNLPSYYKHEQLKIYANFQYNLSRRIIYGYP